ncbi:diacylglycerol/lipid kinase family protein [Protaetiibacter larvae]|uniref:YegS/Rv2252/BmrU family lipid kinase n=1 Tax=Protaetiibacter larvae TaxID=2592654 RepID=A0A5C1YA19_9MICO|nr:YegS/Rv2252/BmrU family lipid kinase [Protaetiibacter larvae]QEO10666.1 YegS/Rv2252/BmrU family lipid kinase [Protaetiibacter larvae]
MTTRPKRVVVAINPSASFGSSRDVGPAVVQTLRALGHEVTSLTEPDFDSLMVSARAAVTSRPDALVVVGGDGMVNLGTNLLVGTKVPLGIVPSGTGNDMARGLGIPFDDTEAAIRHLDAALQRSPRVIDAARIRWTDADGSASERWFACALSAGFDAIVNERANLMQHPKGPSRYILALLAELVGLTPHRYRVELDGEALELDALMVSVGNSVSLGGGMKITPDAALDDGLLDVMIVKPLSRLSFLRIFPRVFQGTHTSDPRVVMRRAKRVRIEVDTEIVAYADGERIAPLPLEVEVEPGALRVLA